MEYLKLIIALFCATGFWRGLEFLFQHQLNKKFKKAEIRNLNEQSNDKVISNWITWSDKMEERIEELEKDNKEMRQIILKQREKINVLEAELKKYQKQQQ
ncbi:hypothetical protein [Aquimarina pacifica]|uniref:hypothetical protein n=1 Tax=Aquimarina pacifica TaxID=1296415 RepID=UPI000472CC4D|nr:hypothetical protein [Aquimarina pacifica]